ncbi:glycosyltransferase family 4 protein [Rhizobium sp. L1K21]|uniref:glycosyltransferase family 4 protein n=1 Tax=Rhizobium sp. L1K21 TaxID=2954933 RepID=UPI002093D198|nr:glycosyltransferase family 4 protein [Rhizobium sp. L1K21]MCO6184850.1 glycosyltransferase family 4 protein [Rhizobium sp. L1K21]
MNDEKKSSQGEFILVESPVAIIEPVGGHGGMDHYDFGLLSGLRNAGVDAALYTCEQTVDYEGHRIIRYFDKVYDKSLSKFMRLMLFAKGLIYSLADAHAAKSKLVHYHFFGVGGLEAMMLMAARIAGFRILVTVHDIESFSVRTKLSGAMRIFYKIADAYIVHNESSKREFLSTTSIDERKVNIVPHGNYLHVLGDRWEQSDARAELKIPQDKKVVLFFGQIKDVKGLDLLLEAAARVNAELSDLFLLIAGRPWKTDFSRYHSIIREQGIEEICRLEIRYIPDEEIPLFFAAADMVCLPYRKIYQSGVLLQAMSRGKPVIASDLPGMVEMIDDGKNGFLFKTEDVESLAEAIRRAFGSDQILSQCGEAALEKARDQYGWDAVGILTRNVYTQLLTRS